MLSQKTLQLLKTASEKSNIAYEYGGFNFYYSLSTCAPLKLKNRERIHKLKAEQNVDLYPDEIETLSEFFELALYPHGTGKISSDTSDLVRKLTEYLSADFPGAPKCLIEPIETPLSSEIALLILGNNYYHELRFLWSPS